ncbi:MAG: hypothetical protein HY695_03300 [Deltaproteobacteria bacterium]|nr:hypothetical protein [Deltaproteobacteria bacterium]
MTRYNLLFATLVFFTAACSVTTSQDPVAPAPPEYGLADSEAVSGPQEAMESEAQLHLSLAAFFEQASRLDEATLAYVWVAEKYNETSSFPEAVRKAALLYGTPSNPVADDPSALRWMLIYFALPLADEEKRHVELHLALLQRLIALKENIAQEKNLRQRASSLAIRRGADLSVLARRIRELEVALQETKQEIESLKEVDVETSRIRITK